MTGFSHERTNRIWKMTSLWTEGKIRIRKMSSFWNETKIRMRKISSFQKLENPNIRKSEFSKTRISESEQARVRVGAEPSCPSKAFVHLTNGHSNGLESSQEIIFKRLNRRDLSSVAVATMYELHNDCLFILLSMKTVSTKIGNHCQVRLASRGFTTAQLEHTTIR